MEEEKPGGDGASTTFDFNDNEEEERGGGVKAGLRASITSALLAGVSGGQAAGKGHFCVSAHRGKFTGEEMNLPPDHMITPARCDVPEVLNDHSGLNGFCQEEEEVMRGGGAGRLCLAETTATSCPAVLQGWWKGQGDETKENSNASVEVEEEVRTLPSLKTQEPPQQQEAPPQQQEPQQQEPQQQEEAQQQQEEPQNCACTVAMVAPSAGILTNGVVVSEDFPHSSAALQGHVKCGRVKVANGRLHAGNCHGDVTPGHKTMDGTAECQRLWQDELPPCPTAPIHDQDCPPTPGSSDKLPRPRPSSSSNPDSSLSGADSAEDEAELSLPTRPQHLRTNPAPPLSLSCDATPLTPDEEGGFYFGDLGYSEDCRNVLETTGRRQSAPDTLPDPSDHAHTSDPKLLPKRFGIAHFFTRSLFSRKSKEPKTPSHHAVGWRLFGKAASRDADSATDSSSVSPTHKDEQMKDSDMSLCSQQLPLAAGRRKKLEFEPLSTTALILEDRPANLPAKSEEETQRHKQEYEEMVAGAKKRELKEAQKKKRQMKERHRQEDNISNAMIVWNNDILPHWDTVKGTRRVRELWWQGLPPSVRGRVWSLAIGNELNITPELYEIFLSRAKEKWRSYSETSSVNDSESDGGASLADRESSLDLIKLDISRTFPSLFIFQKGGPYHDLLHSVLGAYTCYRPDIGYVQGMSFIAAVLILNLEEADAFITFANLLNKPCQMVFFRVDHDLMMKYFAAFEVFFEENLPQLFSHFQISSLTPDLYLIDWIFTLFSKSLPLDVACRVWDVFCRDGEESLFRAGLGILRLYEDVLLQMDFIHIAQFLARLPDDLQPHTLFNAMANTHMLSRNRRWAQVFSALTKDANKETDKSSSPALRS